MSIESHSSRDELYRIASSQGGFFTARQAKAAGYTDNNFPYYLRAGNWIKEYRGIYRLSRFPESTNSQLILWMLWSQNRQGIPQGVYSHETALSIHELSDIMPGRLHMTVPRNFRRNGPIPSVLILHRCALTEHDIESIDGARVTRPLRTILDIVEAQTLSSDHIEQALREALHRGLIPRHEAAECRETGTLFSELLDRIEGTA